METNVSVRELSHVEIIVYIDGHYPVIVIRFGDNFLSEYPWFRNLVVYGSIHYCRDVRMVNSIHTRIIRRTSVMGIVEILGVIAGVVALFMSMMVRSERDKRKVAETKVSELETEALHMNQRVESAEALQKIEHDRRVNDESIKVPSDRRNLGGTNWLHDTDDSL